MANQTYYWVIPIIGAFFSLIALLFPAAYFEVVFIFSIESRIWMWGYVYLKTVFKETSGFGTNPDFLLVCMVSTLIVIISAIMLIILANNLDWNHKDDINLVVKTIDGKKGLFLFKKEEE